MLATWRPLVVPTRMVCRHRGILFGAPWESEPRCVRIAFSCVGLQDALRALSRIILARGLKLPFKAIYVGSIDGPVPQHDVGDEHEGMLEPLDQRAALVFRRRVLPTDTGIVSAALTFNWHGEQ